MAGISTDAADLAADLEEVATGLRDLTPAAELAAAIVLPVAVAQAPRLTGTLAASLRSVVVATGYTIEAAAPYAPYVHARNPWIVEVIRGSEAEQVAAVAGYLEDHLST